MSREQERHPQFFINAHRAYDRAWIDRQNAEIAAADVVLTGSIFARVH